MTDNGTKISEKKPKWKKIFIIVTVAILLVINIAVQVYIVREAACRQRNSGSYRTEVIDPELRTVLNIEPENNRSHSVVSMKDIGINILGTAIIMLIPNGLCAGIAFTIYKVLDRKNEPGGWISPLVVTVIVTACVIVCVVGAGRYINRAKNCATSVRAHAPVIYLYGDNETQVNVQVDLNGSFTLTYPQYDSRNGWTVTPSSDGTLTDINGDTYDFLFWEGDMWFEQDRSQGFCIPGDETEEFLSRAASELGLNETEASAFVGYWTPKMENNPYNVIMFQGEGFDEAARLDIDPAPDVLIRVNMLWYPSDEFVDVDPQPLSQMGVPLSDRHGLTAVEWGGEMVMPE